MSPEAWIGGERLGDGRDLALRGDYLPCPRKDNVSTVPHLHVSVQPPQHSARFGVRLLGVSGRPLKQLGSVTLQPLQFTAMQSLMGASTLQDFVGLLTDAPASETGNDETTRPRSPGPSTRPPRSTGIGHKGSRARTGCITCRLRKKVRCYWSPTTSSIDKSTLLCGHWVNLRTPLIIAMRRS